MLVQWERLTVEDGTGPGRDYRGAQTWHEKDREERELRHRLLRNEDSAPGIVTPPGATAAARL